MLRETYLVFCELTNNVLTLTVLLSLFFVNISPSMVHTFLLPYCCRAFCRAVARCRVRLSVRIMLLPLNFFFCLKTVARVLYRENLTIIGRGRVFLLLLTRGGPNRCERSRSRNSSTTSRCFLRVLMTIASVFSPSTSGIPCRRPQLRREYFYSR